MSLLCTEWKLIEYFFMRNLLVYQVTPSVFTLITTTAICLTKILTLFHYELFNGYCWQEYRTLWLSEMQEGSVTFKVFLPV